MTASLDFSTPKEALREMLVAGALFDVRRRDDALGFSFTYRVADRGDAARCRDVLAAVKARPRLFFEAFKAVVQTSAIEGVPAPSRSSAGEDGVSAPSCKPHSLSAGILIEEARTSLNDADAEGVVETPPSLRTLTERGVA